MSQIPDATPSKVSLPADLKAGFWPFLIVFDVVLRWATLGFAKLGMLSAIWVWALHIVVIPLLIFTYAYFREQRLYRKHDVDKEVDLTPDFTAFPATLIFFALIIGGTQVYAYTEGIPWRWLRIAVTIIASAVYAVYVLTVYAASPKLQKIAPPEPFNESECDANDRAIIELDAQRASLQQRVDTYTLESALFGALAFSSFVTIAASEKVRLNNAREFVIEVGRLFRAVVALSGESVIQIANGIAAETPLLAAIAAQTLVCSALFLSVIICRLRFNDLLARTDYYIRLAMQFNDKEDDLQNAVLQLEREPSPALTDRLGQLSANIAHAIMIARQAMRGLRPVVAYMSMFRGMGVMVFLTIIITSSVWISSTLAIFFGALTLTAYLYPIADRWIRDRSLRPGLHLQGAGKLLGFGGSDPKN